MIDNFNGVVAGAKKISWKSLNDESRRREERKRRGGRKRENNEKSDDSAMMVEPAAIDGHVVPAVFHKGIFLCLKI